MTSGGHDYNRSREECKLCETTIYINTDEEMSICYDCKVSVIKSWIGRQQSMDKYVSLKQAFFGFEECIRIEQYYECLDCDNSFNRELGFPSICSCNNKQMILKEYPRDE